MYQIKPPSQLNYSLIVLKLIDSETHNVFRRSHDYAGTFSIYFENEKVLPAEILYSINFTTEKSLGTYRNVLLDNHSIFTIFQVCYSLEDSLEFTMISIDAYIELTRYYGPTFFYNTFILAVRDDYGQVSCLKLLTLRNKFSRLIQRVRLYQRQEVWAYRVQNALTVRDLYHLQCD